VVAISHLTLRFASATMSEFHPLLPFISLSSTPPCTSVPSRRLSLPLKILGADPEYVRECRSRVNRAAPGLWMSPDRGFSQPYEILYRGVKLFGVSAALGRFNLGSGADLPQVGYPATEKGNRS